jgi:hypothetical protein
MYRGYSANINAFFVYPCAKIPRNGHTLVTLAEKTDKKAGLPFSERPACQSSHGPHLGEDFRAVCLGEFAQQLDAMRRKQPLKLGAFALSAKPAALCAEKLKLGGIPAAPALAADAFRHTGVKNVADRKQILRKLVKVVVLLAHLARDCVRNPDLRHRRIPREAGRRFSLSRQLRRDPDDVPRNGINQMKIVINHSKDSFLQLAFFRFCGML